jgi:hypothetical protein
MNQLGRTDEIAWLRAGSMRLSRFPKEVLE